MKSKTKFDPKVIQQFFIDHTEKLVIGLVAALFLFFVYESTLLDHYKDSPEKLQQAAAAAADKIAKGPADMESKLQNLMKDTNYADKIDQFKTPIVPDNYPMPIPMDWKVNPQLHLRQSPRVLVAEHLRAIPGRGGVAEGNATRGMRWIVVTGLVPYKSQLAEYQAKFTSETAYDPVKDVPKYIGYFVQRAEVVPGQTGEPKWKFIYPSIDANDPIAKLGGQLAQEVADPRFVLPIFASPLPLISGATWGTEVVCPPEIPVVERAVIGPGEVPTTGSSAVPLRPVREGPVPPAGMGSTPGPGIINQGTGSLMGPRAAAPGMSGAWGEVVPAGSDAAKRGPEGANPPNEEAQASDYLLRFFDFDVKPNKQYQYRIFLVLENPNYRLDPGVLEDPTLAEYKFIGIPTPQPIRTADGGIDWPTDPKYAEWSLPCTSGRVSGDMRVLCGAVAAGRGSQETSTEVRVLRWLEESGLNGTFSKDGLIRGTILNFAQVAMKIPGAERPAPDDLKTNCILVDIQGGEKLPDKEGHLASPGLILVMDDSGALVMHDEVAEAKEWDEATQGPESGQGFRNRPPRPFDNRNRLQIRPGVPGKVDINELDATPSSRRRPGSR